MLLKIHLGTTVPTPLHLVHYKLVIAHIKKLWNCINLVARLHNSVTRLYKPLAKLRLFLNGMKPHTNIRFIVRADCRLVARTFRRWFTWMSDVYICMHKHANMQD